LNRQNKSYKYNDAGIRTQKVVNGVTTNYHLEGDKVTYESNGTDKIYYTYDSEGDLISMNLNETEYYYIRNAQGDIIGLFDKAGTQVVAYTYDTWGKLISTTGTLASTVGVKNPYRYRGYRYDGETGLYYLNARYYNAEWGRFINADAYGGNVGNLLSHNVFAYCMNNPVNMSDPSGNWPSFSGIIKAAKSVVKNIVKTVVTVVVKAATAVKSTVSRIMNNPYLKGSTSGGIDKAGEHAAKKYISKTTRGFVSTGKLTIQKYVTTPGAAARAAKFTAKKVGVGSVIFTGIDMYESASDKKYVGAGINFLAGAIGVGAGMVIGGILGSIAAPALVVGVIGFGAGVVVGVFIDKGANAITDWYYRRKERNGS